MKTIAEYLELSERYRLAKLSAQDAARRDRLETFARSYPLLARGVQTLARATAAVQEDAIGSQR